MKDYYQVLDVAVDASQDIIKEQYRFLVQAWHPDKFPNSSQKLKAEEKMKEINEAYEILRTPTKRAEYDSRFRSTSFVHEQGYRSQTNQRQSEEEQRRKEEAEHRAREERLRKEREETERRTREERLQKERADKEREEAERWRSEYERKQKEKEELEKRREIEKYGIEVIICPSCGTINSTSFTQCRKCLKDIMKVRQVENPYLSKEKEETQRTQANNSRQQYEQKKKSESDSERRHTEHKQPAKNVYPESPEMERKRVARYGVEIVICSSCGAKNSLSFSQCLKCAKDISREKVVANPYL